MDRQFKRTPPRLSRIFDTYSPPLYFITFNTHLRTAILANESVHDTWKAFCQNASVRRIGVGRYVIMPDHIHCFVRMSGESSLGEWVKVLKQTLGKTLKTLGHTPANLPGQSLSSYWQPGFFDHLMRHSESYSEKCDYVYQNPVRAGLVANPEDWPYQGEIGVLRM